MQEFITIPTDLIRQSKRGSPFSETDAIMDVLTMADENGEFHSTTRKLMSRWGWGSGKTVSFLKKLEKQNIIGTKTEQKRNAKYIVNTDFLNNSKNKNGTQTEYKRNTKKEENTEIYKRIIEHLNMVCGTNYRQNNQQTVRYINARLSEGFTENDFCTVIDKKAKEWLGTEWEKYLRPSTLFGNKFGEYLNQKIVKEKPKNKFNGFQEREYDFSELERNLL